MGCDFIQQSIKLTLISALLISGLISIYMGLFEGFGIILGASWGCLNLVLIQNTLNSLLADKSKNPLKIIALLGLKFPVLYGLGYLLLASEYFPVLSLLAGSSIIFLVIFLNSLRFFFTKAAIFIFVLFTTSQAFASLDAEVPELPNIFTFLHEIFHGNAFFTFLKQQDSIVFSIIIASIISLVFYFGTRNKEMIPSGLQNFLELVVDTLRNFVLEILGPRGEKYVPLLGTLFIYILAMNWVVLIPFFKSPSSNFNITVALAICVFVLVQYLNIKNWGLKGFLYHLAGSPKDTMGWCLVPLMFPIELLTQFTRPVTLALRLFGNVVGEDIMIGAFALFGVSLLAYWNLPIGIPLQIPFMFLSLLTGLMQALVFTLLSTIYILLSMPEEEEEPA